jgi:hypothetical protein
MTIYNTKDLVFSTTKGRKVGGVFSGGDITSDGGVMLLNQTDRKMKLTTRPAQVINFDEDPVFDPYMGEEVLSDRPIISEFNGRKFFKLLLWVCH